MKQVPFPSPSVLQAATICPPAGAVQAANDVLLLVTQPSTSGQRVGSCQGRLCSGTVPAPALLAWDIFHGRQWLATRSASSGADAIAILRSDVLLGRFPSVFGFVHAAPANYQLF